MPAGSEPLLVELPHTFRPLGVRLAIIGFGSMLFVVCVVTWFAFPPHIRDEFTTFQRLTVIALGLGFAAIGLALARSRVVARTTGVTIVNGYRARRYEWNEIVAVSLRPGSPWAELDLSDGTTVAALGIQGSDGARAARHVREFRALVNQLTRTDHDT